MVNESVNRKRPIYYKQVCSTDYLMKGIGGKKGLPGTGIASVNHVRKQYQSEVQRPHSSLIMACLDNQTPDEKTNFLGDIQKKGRPIAKGLLQRRESEGTETRNREATPRVEKTQPRTRAQERRPV